MHCRYSKAPTHARFARRLNGEEVKKTHAAMKTVLALSTVGAVATDGQGNELLWCDKRHARLRCLEPPLARVPKRDWFCPDCDHHEPDMRPPQP